MIETVSIWIGIIAVVATGLINSIVWIYTYGKLRGRMEERENRLESTISHLTSRLEAIEKFNLDSDGDIKWLSKKGHTEDCTEHSKIFLIETDNIKDTLARVQKSIVSIQDSILSLATSGRLKGQSHD